MKLYRIIFAIIFIALPVAAASAAQSVKALVAENKDGRVTVGGEHFRIECDAARGGLIGDFQVSDGSQWNRVIGGDGRAEPALAIAAEGGETFDLAKCKARIENFTAAPEKVSWTAVSGDAGPWRVSLSYEVFAEGAVFIGVDCDLLAESWALKSAALEFQVDESIVAAAKYRQSVYARPKTVTPSGRIAFGMYPDRSFTNELAVIVERSAALGGKAGFAERPGRFTWKLGDAPAELKKGFRYENRIAVGATCPVSGKPQTNLFGQRVYHWINYLDRKALAAWYPSDEQIDRMADNGGTMLILHQDWMRQGGSNGKPHADYAVVKHDKTLRRVIAKAHERGMRVGLYRRGIERYGMAEAFQKYLKHNWDGYYVDWHGPHAAAEHEMKNRPEPALGDVHFSQGGELLAARDYFAHAKKLREIVGPDGFLIGHMGFGTAGVFPNFYFDAFLPGEDSQDHRMFGNRDDAVFRGMTCGAVCMPWTVDAPQYTTPENVAKMAAWGFFPHVGLGILRDLDGTTFPLDPDDTINKFVDPYWRVLSKLDAERVTAYNLPNQSRAAMQSSNPAVDGVVYAEDKDGRRNYLIVYANLSDKPAKAVLTLDRKLLGMSGGYRAALVDSAAGESSPYDMQDDSHIETPSLRPWQIMGFKLEKAEGGE